MNKKYFKPTDIHSKSDVDFAVLHDMNLTRESIAQSMRIDLLQAMSGLEVVLSDQKTFDAMVDVFWNRYLTLKDKHLSKSDVSSVVPNPQENAG